MNYIQVKVAKAEINFLKLHGALKLPFHTKRKIIGIENEHREHISDFKKNNSEYIEASKQFLKTNFKGYRDVRWHECYAAQNGIKKVNYIPEDIFYKIAEKLLNNGELANTYTDKNLLQKLFPKISTPITVLRSIHGSYYSEEYNLINHSDIESLFSHEEKYIFKPAIDAGGGHGIIVSQKSKILGYIHQVMRKSNNKNNQNYIVQKYLEQHDSIKSLHPKSLNTIRIMTLRLGENIHLVSSMLRMGVNGNVVDNTRSGGICCGIDKEGYLKKFAFDIVFNRHDIHPNTKIKFDGYEVPYYNNAVELCKSLHKDLLHFDLVSWDIAISAQNLVTLIEFNLYDQGINGLQLCNGPLFGDLTQEVLKTLPQ